MNGAASDEQRAAAKAELERRAANERGRYFTPNGKAEKFIEMLGNASRKPDGITIFILRAGNSFGKTALATNLINYLGDNIRNPFFDKVDYLRNFRRPNRGRLCTTANAAKNTYGEEIPKWLSRNQYSGLKVGREFESKFKFKRTGSEFDIFTFDQDPDAGESITLDWAIVDEPMSRRHFSGLKSRLRFGGIIVFILTPLEGSGWYHDLFETPERIGKDVFVMEGSSEDNCKEHGIRGVIPHAALADMWKDFDEAELPARRDGKYLHLAGAIYRTYRDDSEGHVWDTLPDYYRECYNAKNFTLYFAVDPHDRKPFACAWHAVFPDEHVVTIAEWPDANWRPFHKIRSCEWDVPTYVKMVNATEKAIGKQADIRLIDPNFGPARKAGREGVLEQFRKSGLPNGWKLPPDSINEGHIAVRELLGDPSKNIAPRWHILAHCKNTRFGMSHYGYKENRDESKGLSETPELVHKDFPDVAIRYPALYGLKYRRKDLDHPLHIHSPVIRGSSTYRGV